MTDGFLARLLGRRTAPPAPPKPPEIDAVRCVHGQVADASCLRCGLACPHGAIEFAARDLELDTAKCDGCGPKVTNADMEILIKWILAGAK